MITGGGAEADYAPEIWEEARGIEVYAEVEFLLLVALYDESVGVF